LIDVHVAAVVWAVILSAVDGTVVGAGGRLTAAAEELENGKHFLQEVKGANSIGFGPLTSLGEQINGGPLNKKV
jgi:hypothetical protein